MTTGSAHQIELIPVDQITPYTQNPRNNEPAVDAVIASIMQFGFRVPLVVAGDDNVIVAGHTRHLAITRILERDPDLADRFGSIPCFRADDLTEDQIKAFRLVDNKTAELAEWDFDMLSGEVSALADAGIDLQEFGWSREEIDCLRSVVAEDCLNPNSWNEAAGGGDGINHPVSPRPQQGQSADGTSVRITVGTFGFMILRDDFETWFDGLMKKNSFDYEQANTEIAGMLGLREARDKRDRFFEELRVKNTKVKEEDTESDETDAVAEEQHLVINAD